MSESNRRSDAAQEDLEKSGQEIAEEAKATAGEYAGQAQEKTTELGEQAREGVEAGREQAASGMDRAAGMLREKTGEGGGVTSEAGAKVAKGMDGAKDYLRDHDTSQMWSDFEDYARKHPAQTIAGAVVVGLLIGKLMR